MEYHVCIDIDRAIENAKMLKGFITLDGRTLQTVAEIRAFLREQKKIGRRVLPIGDCDNFDYEKGCLGHFTEDKQ